MRLPQFLAGATGRAGLATAFAVVLLTAAAAPTSAATAGSTASTAADQAAIQSIVRDHGVSPAEAARRLAAQPAQSTLADRLTRELGAHQAGAFIDTASGDLVVNVLDSATAAHVTAAGARARVVQHSTAQLEKVKAELDRLSGPVNSSWGIDVTANAVVVSIPAAATAFAAQLGGYGDLVRVVRTDRAVSPQVFYGGQAIYAGGIRCSSAFNARNSAGAYYVITAGHCTQAAANWTTGSQTIGTRSVASFPTNDYGTIRVTNSALGPVGAIRYNSTTRTITGYSRVAVGSSVCKTGSTTGTTCGTVSAYNVTVRYAEGSVYQMTQTNVCTQPGDSGGGLFAGSLAQGIVSGGTTGGCTSTSRSFFQPIGEALTSTGLTLL